MPIVLFPRCFDGYSLSAIPADMLKRMQAATHWKSQVKANAVRLQAFCELTDQTLIGLSDRAKVALLEEFAAASFSAMFRDPARPGGAWLTLAFLRSSLPQRLRFEFPTVPNQKGWPEQFRRRVNEYDRFHLDSELSEFWKGWAIENAAGQRQALNLHRFWTRRGAERTRELFGAADTFFSSRRNQRIPYIEALSDYLSEDTNVDLSDSLSLGQAVHAFMHQHLHKVHNRGVRVSVALADWKIFVHFLTNHLLGHAWATPIPALPTPTAPKVIGVTTNLRKTSQGRVVKTVLITPVPLHITDTEATELLFRDVQRESDAIISWARYEIAEAKKRIYRRRELAPTGTASVGGHSNKNTGIIRRLSRACPEHLAHAAATFEANGFGHLGGLSKASRLYPKPLHQTSWELGIPSPNLLVAHAAVLVYHHPSITPAFLADLELLNADGRQIGLVEADSGWYLRSQKRRRGPRLAEQEVLLNAETLAVVRDVIEMTAPLREWLRHRKDSQWRRLFLAVASIGNTPKKWGSDLKIYRRSQWLSERLVHFAKCGTDNKDLAWLADPKRAQDLANRMSIKRLRAQQGVLVYLKTGSVEQMAKALGHHIWSPTLLDRYLPRPIQQFFVERWIRLFQTGIICEALSSSSYLLDASPFSTMDELDAFLEHHALRRLPAHLENPDQIGGRPRRPKTDNRVVFGIEVGVLTVLISLEAAVRTAEREPCGRAVRWARISERLVPHLETQTEQPEFRAMVAEARRHSDPRRVGDLIYG